jgi:hypothetical protein
MKYNGYLRIATLRGDSFLKIFAVDAALLAISKLLVGFPTLCMKSDEATR